VVFDSTPAWGPGVAIPPPPIVKLVALQAVRAVRKLCTVLYSKHYEYTLRLGKTHIKVKDLCYRWLGLSLPFATLRTERTGKARGMPTTSMRVAVKLLTACGAGGGGAEEGGNPGDEHARCRAERPAESERVAKLVQKFMGKLQLV
jgi:hypothetical protein